MRDAVQTRQLDVFVDSAGTGAWHAGDPPDTRMMAAAAERGIDLSAQRARKVRAEDFREFTHIYAMDQQNYADLQAIKPANATAQLQLFLGKGDVPDPYYGGADGFDHVLDLVQRRVRQLLDELTDEARTSCT